MAKKSKKENQDFFFTAREDDTDHHSLSVNYLIPNIVTVIALCTGLTAIQFGIDGRWGGAALLILFAAALDGVDGTIARLLKATSDFGAQLDSLSDFVSFGVAPSVILYLWQLKTAGSLGWVVSLFLCVAMALRLARFNTKKTPHVEPTEITSKKAYFEGVPAPAGAILALFPLYLNLEIDQGVTTIYTPSIISVIWVGFISALILSRIPTFSLKRLKLSPKYFVPTLGGVALFIAGLVSEPWLTVIVFSLIYLAVIPFSYLRYKRLYWDNQES